MNRGMLESSMRSNSKRSLRSWFRPRDIVCADAASIATNVSEFTNHTESMTASPGNSHESKLSPPAPLDNESSASSLSQNSSALGENEGDDGSTDTTSLGDYSPEDLFKLLEAQQTITKSLSDITVGMAGIIERYHSKRFKQKEMKTVDDDSDQSTVASSTSTSSSSKRGGASSSKQGCGETGKAHRVCKVVESMALRHDALSIKVVGIAVNALQQLHDKEQERQRLEDKVNQLEAYISSHRKKSKWTRSSRSSKSEGPPGFSGSVEVNHTIIDICQITADEQDGVESVVPEVSDNASVRFVM
jgi:hypothetical protein